MRIRVSSLLRNAKAESPDVPEVKVQLKVLPLALVSASRSEPAVGLRANMAFRAA